MFAEQKPDIVLIEQQDIDKALVMAVNTYPDVPIILFGVHCPSCLKIAAMCLPSFTAQHVKDNTDVPNIEIQPAADITRWQTGFYTESMKSDILYVSTSPCTVSNTYFINTVLTSLPYKIKIVGSAKIDSALWCGYVSRKDIANFIASTKICLNFADSELYNLIYSRAFVLTSNTNQDLMPKFESVEEFLRLVDQYVVEERIRRKYIKTAHKVVIADHTYFHRIIELGKLIDISWGKGAQEALQGFII